MAKTHREIEDESMRLVSDSSNLSKGGEDYDEKYKKLLGKYGLERKETDFEKDMKTYSPSIKAGIKTSQERNKALAESRKETPKAEQAAPKTHRTIEEEPMKPQKSGGSKSAKSTPKAALIAPKTRVTVSKSGGAVAETESALSGDKPRLATSKVSKNTPSRMDEKPPTLKNRTTNTSEKPDSKAVQNYYKSQGANKENSTEKRNAKEAETGTVKQRLAIGYKNLAEKSKVKYTTSKLSLAGLRNEYQQELIKKHKKELAGK